MARQSSVRRIVPALAAAAVVVIAVGAYAVWPDGGTGPDLPVGSPPPAVTGEYRLWLSEQTIPLDGAEIAAVLTGPPAPAGPLSETFGVGAQLDRWDGTSWQPHRMARLCMVFWGCAGALLPLDDPVVVEDIGLSLDPTGVGPTALLRIDELDPGSYRLTQTSNDGVQASGTFDVAQGTVTTVPLGLGDTDRLELQRALLPSAGGELAVSRLEQSADRSQSSSAVAVGQVLALESWSDGAWEPVDTLEVGPLAGDPSGVTLGVEVPALAAGAYRLVDRSQVVGAQAVFWTTDGWATVPDAGSPSAP